MGMPHLKRGQYENNSFATVVNILSSLLLLLIIKIMTKITTNYDDYDDKCRIVTTTFSNLFPVSVYPVNNACSMTKAEYTYACCTSAVVTARNQMWPHIQLRSIHMCMSNQLLQALMTS
jgi:hypothetical protein